MDPLPESSANEQATARLKQFFQRNGYVRVADRERIERLGRQKYKKGYEVRLVARTESELAQIRDLLQRVGFKPGKPFRKSCRIVQPVYGKAAVEWFLSKELE